jgi:hypothetical protein
MLLIPWTAMAGPPTDGVCGELKGGTPGLFGLCVAFCEAQDLGDAPESKQSAFSLLAAYEARRGAEDPEMPCLDSTSSTKPQPPAAECDCFTTDELMSALPQPSRCVASGGIYSASQDFPTGTSTAYVEESMLGGSCSIQDGNGQIADYFNFTLTQSQVEGCKALWTHHAEVTGCL